MQKSFISEEPCMVGVIWCYILQGFCMILSIGLYIPTFYSKDKVTLVFACGVEIWNCVLVGFHAEDSFQSVNNKKNTLNNEST